jgi:hypothetical protein
MTYLDRYLAGDHERVWSELFLMGEEVRGPELFGDAWEVALETMRRVRANVETVQSRLAELGYPFLDPEGAHLPPRPGVAEEIARFEADFGRLPLSLRAFYEVVGSVNWIQDRRRRMTEAVYALGDLDPLLIESYDALVRAYEWERTPRSRSRFVRWYRSLRPVPPMRIDRLDFAVSDDPVNKGGYAGVGPVTIRLPDARIDAPVCFEGEPLTSGPEEEIGSTPQAFRPGGIQEIWTFVSYLRKTFRCGGFLSLLHEEVGPEIRDLRERLGEGLLGF